MDRKSPKRVASGFIFCGFRADFSNDKRNKKKTEKNEKRGLTTGLSCDRITKLSVRAGGERSLKIEQQKQRSCRKAAN